ncbi:MAG TPA: DUF4199 domain-containing protein [Bacteroidales bacterium]|nr:DUF4199 domain-containing protein [Bacteroidales bacterium]
MEINNETGIENKPVKHTKELFKNTLYYGLMLAGAMILLDLLSYTFDFSGLGMFFGFVMLVIILAIYIGFFIWAGRTYRNKFYNGYINYGNAFVFCLLMAVVSVLVLALYYYVFYSFFDPERAANETQKAIEMIQNNDFIPDENKEEAIQGMMEKMTTAKIVTNTLISSFIRGVILGAIAALFIRKREKINDVVL